MFQPAVPVAKVLQGIHNREYVRPAIQREFVGKTEQIRSLFDSLMRGYIQRGNACFIRVAGSPITSGQHGAEV